MWGGEGHTWQLQGVEGKGGQVWGQPSWELGVRSSIRNGTPKIGWSNLSALPNKWAQFTRTHTFSNRQVTARMARLEIILPLLVRLVAP